MYLYRFSEFATAVTVPWKFVCCASLILNEHYGLQVRADTVEIPTAEIKKKLRLLRQPITLFGEVGLHLELAILPYYTSSAYASCSQVSHSEDKSARSKC